MAAAHDFSKSYIETRLQEVGKSIIAAVGEQMGINRKSCSIDAKRIDSVKFFPEVTVRYTSDQKTRFSDDKQEHFRNDGVLFVRPGQWGLNATPTKMKAFTVGLEIKERLEDLAGDEKILMYMGWTDFYFLVVPPELELAAIAKLDVINDARLGLFVMNPAFPRVVRVPLRQDSIYANKYALAMQCLFSDRPHTDVEYELSGCESADLDPAAYQNAFRNLHPEFDGAEDTFLRNKENMLGGLTGKELRTLAEGETATVVSEEEKERREVSAQRKAAKLAREEALADALAGVESAEVKKRLVVQRNDAQTVYHKITQAPDSVITAEQLAEDIGISKRSVEASLASLREAGLIRSEGCRKKPQIAIVTEFEETGEYAKCSLFAAVKSPSEKRRIRLVCAECALRECPAHP